MITLTNSVDLPTDRPNLHQKGFTDIAAAAMGCCASTKKHGADGLASARGLPVSPVTQVRERKAYSAFLSHYKMEAATDARWLQGELEPLLGGRPFLDSDGAQLLFASR